MRRLGLILAMLVVASCTQRPGVQVLAETHAIPPGAKTVTVYVATNRTRAPGNGGGFTSERGALNFAEYVISIPPSHEPGRIEWPREGMDASGTFSTVRQRALSRAEFEAATSAKTAAGRSALFVHGFNVSFQEALFQLAQMSVDADLRGSPVLFAWPSRESAAAYLADKDAVTASRDGLADVVRILTRGRHQQGATLLAHSMGGWLTMETLRQLKLGGDGGALGQLDVILAAPDIDSDVFLSQMSTIGRMKRTMRVLVATDDFALRLSSRLAGGRNRVGKIDVGNPRVQEAAARFNIQTVDISAIKSSDGLNHSRFAQVAAIQARLASVGSGDDGVRRVGAFVLDAVGATLATPFSAAGQALTDQ